MQTIQQLTETRSATDLLRSLGLPSGTGKWNDYELAKKLIPQEVFDCYGYEQSIKEIADYVGV